MRIPILGSAAVKARSEVYQDLLDLQIKASSGQSYSNTIFVGRRSGDVDVHRVDSSEDEDEDCGLEDVHVMLGLCSLLRTLCKERSYNSDKNGVRYKLRFQLFQHLIGLDERWSLDMSVKACEFVEECMTMCEDSSRMSIVSQQDPFFESNEENYTFRGPKSALLSDAIFNILSRGLPSWLHGSTCSVRYSTAIHGASLLTLLALSEESPYKACMIVIKDTIGHIFGGFVSQQLVPHREYFGNGECFVFCVFPSTKLYTWSKRNDYFCYVSNENIGMGGGGDGFAVLLDEDLMQGSSSKSDTFLNPILSFTEQFQCTDLELIVFE